MSNYTDTQERIEELSELLRAKRFQQLHELISETNEIDVAAFMEQLTPLQQITCFRTLSKDQASDIFAELEPETQQTINSAKTDRE